MVWKLCDLCLKCVETNLASYPNLGSMLPTVYKEILIERLAYHDHFFPDQVMHINNSLFSSTLRHIHLKGCDQITDVVLQLLGQSGCKLEVLTLSRLNHVSDSGVQAITKGQDALLILNIEFLPLITQKILGSIAAPKMWSFKLVHTPNTSKNWYTAAMLSSFLSQNPSIKVLKIYTDAEYISVIARSLQTSLEELKTPLQTVTDESIEALALFCPNLRKLDLNGAKFVGKESLIKLFQACTQMVDLDLSYCSRIAKECEVLWTLPQSLTSLSLCGLALQDEDILVESVTRLPCLTSIKLCGVPALNDDSLAKIVVKIGHKLLDLNLSGVGAKEISDTGLTSVAKFCTMLNSLHISVLRQVTGASLRPIFVDYKRASRMQKLSVNCKQMDVNTLDQIMISCPNLVVLNLSGLSTVNDEMIINLADHSPKLTDLDLNGCKLVTDAAICYISGCCPLTSLCLSGLHAVTDKSIFSLASSCPQLQEIFLNGCSHVSPVAVQYLKDCCLGRLYAKHNIPNASPNQLMAKNLDTGEFCRADLL